ncbi:MAG: ecdysteroid 22-kinase family protein [Agarilytica sp.]
MPHEALRAYLLKITGASAIKSIKQIQELWSSYGEILRVRFSDSAPLVVKRIQWPESIHHPRGWGTDFSHQRKVKSYDVEINFYQQHATVNDFFRTPKYLATTRLDKDIVLVLEDLDAQGFSRRPTSLTREEIESCLHWLANFHAHFLEKEPTGLWQTGTYWHLATRPDELKTLTDSTLKNAAEKFDQALKQVPQTFVHGDAKLANFCFGDNSPSVAAVDFQYVGGGCGMQDVAYFIGSCLNERECEDNEQWILDHYFSELRLALKRNKHPIVPEQLEKSWRYIFPVAWADFYRFLEGWSPGHWKINDYSQKMYRKALKLVTT